MSKIYIEGYRPIYTCPYCGLEETYNGQKSPSKRSRGYITKKCACGEKIGVAVNMRGQIVGFKLT